MRAAERKMTQGRTGEAAMGTGGRRAGGRNDAVLEWLQVATHAPAAAGAHQAGEEDSSDEPRGSQSTSGPVPPLAPDSPDWPPGCVELVVTVFSPDGDARGRGPKADAALMADVLDCLPPSVALLHRGEEEQFGDRGEIMAPAPEVRLVFPPCVPCGEEMNVEIHLGPCGCDRQRGVKVVGAIGGEVFLDESAQGAGSVLRVRIPELQPGIVNFMLTGKGEGHIAECKVAPLGVLPKATADDGIKLYCKLIRAMCRPGATLKQDQRSSTDHPSRVVFAEESVEEQVWDNFSTFLLELEAMLEALDRYRVGELESLHGSAWEQVLQNLICHMVEFDAWEMICFLLGRCVDANVAVDLGGFIPSLEDLVSGVGLKAQVLGTGVQPARSASPDLCVTDEAMEGSTTAADSFSLSPAGSEQRGSKGLEDVAAVNHICDGALKPEFSCGETSEGGNGKRDVEDERGGGSFDEPAHGCLLEMDMNDGNMTEASGIGQANELDGMEPSDSGPLAFDNPSSVAPVATVGLVEEHRLDPQTQRDVGKSLWPKSTGAWAGQICERGLTQDQKSKQAQSLIKRFQQLAPSSAPRKAKRDASPKEKLQLQFVFSKPGRAQALDLSSHDDDQTLSGSSLISSTVPSSLALTDNTGSSGEVPTPREGSPGVLHSMSSIVRKVLGLKASRQAGGAVEEPQDCIPTAEPIQGSDAHLEPVVPKADSGYFS
ncbi:unnamed protein product [Ostreobium quekettii]|uniref:Uncharacterized protein n=1 Tax=Ostreobium quekettii TaxID=121088 RepID=A0A8S1IV00_9CHLO|nr:unnamed protein product [Ostreobium quekettii]|eukprot:evm.model.scf_309.3 EVM.evm.TU.scf_309.3   scf_309:61612-65795(-)